MADYDSSLPIRSEADGTDERVHAKLVDYTNPDTQQLEIDTDNNAHVEVHGNRADDDADVTLVLSEDGKPNGRGDYESDDNSEPNTAGVIAHNRSATHDDTQLAMRPTAVAGEGDSHCLDISLHDAAGNIYDEDNPLPVFVGDNPADEILDYDEAVDIAKDVTDDHDYTVPALKTFKGVRLLASASGKMKVEVQVETGVGTGTYTNKYVAFNSTSNNNIDLPIDKILQVAAGVNIRIAKTNLDNQSQSLYHTLTGLES